MKKNLLSSEYITATCSVQSSGCHRPCRHSAGKRFHYACNGLCIKQHYSSLQKMSKTRRANWTTAPLTKQRQRLQNHLRTSNVIPSFRGYGKRDVSTHRERRRRSSSRHKHKHKFKHATRLFPPMFSRAAKKNSQSSIYNFA